MSNRHDLRANPIGGTVILILPTLVTFALVAAAVPAMNPDDPEHPARASLIAEHTSLKPGDTARIGVLLDIDPEWYLYWDGFNDTGAPPDIQITLPEGFRAGKVLWPAPERKVSPGDILDHIYKHQVLLMIPVEVPVDAEAGEIVITADVEWLVCRDACIPGWGTYQLAINVAEADSKVKPSSHAPLFASTTRRLPKALPEYGGPISTTRSADSFDLAAPDAIRIAFYPGNDCARIENLLTGADVERKSLALHLTRPEQSDRIQGIIEIWTAPSESTVWWIDTAAPPADRQATE